MSYNVVTTEGIRTFENIDDAGDYAQAMSLRTGEPAKVFHAETGLRICAGTLSAQPSAPAMASDHPRMPTGV